MQILFHGTAGPFLIQMRASLDPAAPWVDIPNSVVTELQPGVYMGMVPSANAPLDLSFYRIIAEGESSAELDGWTAMLRVSTPANGVFFATGEQPVVTVTLLDTMAQALSKDDFGSLNLYMYGPQDPLQTTTAAALLNASTVRTNSTHHYVNLKNNPNVQVNGNTITYQLQAVSAEKPGTYTVSLWASLAADGRQQIMKFANVQIGNNTVENPVVTKVQCAACHEGPVSGKIYMHHIDPGFSPTGNWALDFQPVTSCKSCHNNDGYAAYTDASGAKVPDPIVRRVHGLHNGANLQLPFNTNSTNGDFAAYTDVEFPADIRNCTACHVDDRWKTQPSRLACGSCHDTVWFGAKPVPADRKAHGGGTQTDDSKCSVCHVPDPDPTALFDSITDNHRIPPPSLDQVDVSLSAPANGQFYVAGEKPVVTVVIKDDAGNPIDHTKVSDANFSSANLFVYGPRSRAVPVLTSAAKNVNAKLRASVSNSKAGPWDIAGKVFKIAINGSAPQEITINGTAGAVTPAEFAASVNPVITNLVGGAKATVSGSTVNIKTLIQGADARIEIYNGDVTTAMGWKRGPNTVLEPDVTVAAAIYPNNDLRALSDPLDYSDPMVTRSAANIAYQLDDVAALSPGTYQVYVYQVPKAGKFNTLTNAAGIGHALFQVGSATPEKKVATNCSDCHGSTIFHMAGGGVHPAPFNTDYCVACHDYGHNSTGDMFKNQGGTSLNGWSGFGAMPIVRRVHGVPFGHYLEHPEQIYANATKDTFGGIIFPQDVRNCTKCHAESDSWKQNPSRIACLACHDSDEAKAHGQLMTYIPDATDPYGPTAQESCEVCHGADAEFSPDKVHRLTNPYVPPYPREP